MGWYREQSGEPSSSRSPRPGRWTTRSRQSPRAAPPGGTGPTHTCTLSTHNLSLTAWGRNKPVYSVPMYNVQFMLYWTMRVHLFILCCKLTQNNSQSWCSCFICGNLNIVKHIYIPLYTVCRIKYQNSMLQPSVNLKRSYKTTAILFNSLAVLYFSRLPLSTFWDRICNNGCPIQIFDF